MEELLQQLIPVFGGGLRQTAEEFHGHRLLPDGVLGHVHHGKAALAREMLDAILLGNNLSGDVERIFVGHREGLRP